MTYKNIGFSTKTFYGVTFAPGEVKDVPGYINASGMVRVTISNEDRKVYKKRGRKPSIQESKPMDSASIEINDNINITKEELTDG